MYIFSSTTTGPSLAILLTTAVLPEANVALTSHMTLETGTAQSNEWSDDPLEDGGQLDTEFQNRDDSKSGVLLSWKCNPRQTRGFRMSLLYGSDEDSSRIRGFTGHLDKNHSGFIPANAHDLGVEHGQHYCYVGEFLNEEESAEEVLEKGIPPEAIIARSAISCTPEVPFDQAEYTVTEGNSISITVTVPSYRHNSPRKDRFSRANPCYGGLAVYRIADRVGP